MVEEKAANLREVMKYFDSTNTKQFAEEWKELTPEEKDWFKAEVGAIINNVEI